MSTTHENPRSAAARLLMAGLAGLMLLAPAPAQAEVATLNPILFQPAVFRGDLLTLSRAQTGGELGFTVAFNAHYTEAPLSFTGASPFGGTVTETTVGNRLMGELLVGFSFIDILEFGLAMPLVLIGDGETGRNRFTGTGDTSGFHVGELRVSMKAQLAQTSVYGAALVAEMTAPTADEHSVVGNGLGGGGRLVMDFYAGPFTVTLNGGVYARADTARLGDLSVEHELLMGLGGELEIVSGLSLLGETFVRTAMDGPFEESGTAMETVGGLRWTLPVGLSMTVGGGGGAPFFNGYGTSKFRFFGDIRYAFETQADADMDGIRDKIDQCDTLPEDLDAFEDDDGCPDPDNDEDGYLDDIDECPYDAEDFDQHMDRDGCPDWDNDSDYLQDDEDRCTGESEDLDGFEDDDGCPDPDNDRDGILDVDDACPMVPESHDGFQDADGCPDYEGVTVVGDELVMNAPVRFDSKTNLILPSSYDILRAVARFMNDKPTYHVVRVDVHTAKAGPRERVALDAKLVSSAALRATQVLQFLVTEGVAPRRLKLRAVGGAEPIVNPRDKRRVGENARVKLFVVERQ